MVQIECHSVYLQINVWHVLWLYLLLTHGAVFHEVADLATDAAAAVIGSHFSLGEDFRIKEILLEWMKTNHNFDAFIKPPKHANMVFTLQILTIWLGYTEGKALTGVPNSVLPLMKAFMMKLVTVLMTKNKDVRRQENTFEKTRSMRQEIKTRTEIIVLFLDRPAPRLWFRSNGSVIWKREEKATQLNNERYFQDNYLILIINEVICI